MRAGRHEGHYSPTCIHHRRSERNHIALAKSTYCPNAGKLAPLSLRQSPSKISKNCLAVILKPKLTPKSHTRNRYTRGRIFLL